MVEFSQILSDDMFLPGGVLIPGHLVLIHQDNIWPFISVDIGNSYAVADLDLVDLDGPEFCSGRGVNTQAERREEEPADWCVHKIRSI